MERHANARILPLGAELFAASSRRIRAVEVKCHPIENSLVEGVLSRGDRRVAAALELAWRRGARLDSWGEQFDAERWWQALADCGIDAEAVLHRTEPLDARLPWDHINVRKGRTFLEKEQTRAVLQLAAMADAVRVGATMGDLSRAPRESDIGPYPLPSPAPAGY